MRQQLERESDGESLEKAVMEFIARKKFLVEDHRKVFFK